jgi:translation initiation factor IF-2
MNTTTPAAPLTKEAKRELGTLLLAHVAQLLPDADALALAGFPADAAEQIAAWMAYVPATTRPAGLPAAGAKPTAPKPTAPKAAPKPAARTSAGTAKVATAEKLAALAAVKAAPKPAAPKPAPAPAAKTAKSRKPYTVKTDDLPDTPAGRRLAEMRARYAS